MTPALLQLLDHSAGRYLDPDEQRRVLDFTASLPERFRAADAVKGSEDAVVDGTLGELRERHGEFMNRSVRFADELLPEDLRQSLRFATLAMIRDDEAFQEDRLLAWQRSVRENLNIPPDFIRDAYSTLRDRVRQTIPEESFVLVRPFLDRNLDEQGRAEEGMR